MKKTAAFLCLLALATGCNPPVTPPTNSTGNTTYYVDSQNGSDTNAGTSEGAAWKTFTNVNAITFAAGDKILLKSGGVWTGQLHPLGNGGTDNPITLGSYGTGSKPLISAGGITGAAVYLKNQQNWVIENLEITNTAASRSDVYRWGIQVENNGGGTLSNIIIRNNYVHHVTGSFKWVTGYIDPHLNGGIAVNVTGSAGTDKFDYVVIEGNTVSNSGRTGIVVWDNVWNGSNFASTRVKVRQNTVEYIDSDGILTFGCNGALLEYNVANTCGNYAESGQFNGSCAIWSTRGSDCISQYNEAYNTKALLDNVDGQGFDIDMDATNCIVQYNYSHDNEGGFILLIDARTQPGVYVGTSGAVVRYNISQNDKTRIINFAGGIAPNSAVYNNTFYIGSGLATNIIEHSWDMDMTQPYSFRNNIVYNLGSGGYQIPGPNGTFDYNLFYGNHPATEPADAHKLTSNPLLANPGSGGTGRATVSGYLLGSGSPAAGSGKVIANNGGLDYFGNTITAGYYPSRGAHQVAGGPAGTTPETVTDPLDNFSLVSSRSTNIQLDASNPAYFGGDNSRVTRSSGSVGYITYNLSNLTSFSADIHEFSTDLSKVKCYASADGTTWTLLSSSYTTPVLIANGWSKTTFSGTVPAGNHYLKIELSDASSWGTQIGKVTITHLN